VAEIVKVPVVGNVKSTWLYAGGAAVAGIVGYAWWTRGGGSGETTEDFAVELPATDYVPPTVVDSGINVGGAAQGEPIARTNVEWRTMAQEQGEGLGFSQTTVASALTKYLGKSRLTATEAAAMAAIVAILGQPPTGGPYTISGGDPEPPAAHEVLAVTGLRWEPGGQNPPGYWDLPVSYHGVIAWTPLTGASGYRVRARSGGGVTETEPLHQALALPPGTHTYYVTPLFADNRRGEEASITFTTP